MHAFVRLFATALCTMAAASAVHAQMRQGAPAPSTAARAAQASPNPAGLQSPFPAGITSGSGARVSSDPIASANAPVPPNSAGVGGGTVGGGGFIGVPTELPSGVPNTAVLGAGSSVAGPSQNLNAGAGGFAAADTARSFFFADANHDGELTRAEARRLSIATMSFEEMDRNYDQVISRFEYDDSVR